MEKDKDMKVCKEFVGDRYEDFYTSDEALKERIKMNNNFCRLGEIFFILSFIAIAVSILILASTASYANQLWWMILATVLSIITAVIIVSDIIFCYVEIKTEYRHMFLKSKEFEEQYKFYMDIYEAKQEQKRIDKATYLTKVYTTLDNSKLTKEKKIELVSKCMEEYEETKERY